MIRMEKDGITAEVQTAQQAFVFERNGYVRVEEAKAVKEETNAPVEQKEVKRGHKPRQ